MVSNTKLTKAQKQFVKNFEAEMVNNGAVFISDNNVTMLIVSPFKNSKMVEFAISTMSENEKKFRPSVGKYYAINNYLNDNTIKISRYTDFRELAWVIG